MYDPQSTTRCSRSLRTISGAAPASNTERVVPAIAATIIWVRKSSSRTTASGADFNAVPSA